MRRVADFPDLVSLRAADGRITGLFSDHGAWFGVTWGQRSLLELRTLWNDRASALHLGPPAVRRTVWADCLEAELQNGATVRVGFASDRALVIEYRHGAPPEPAFDLPFTIVRAGANRWLVVVAPEGGGVREPDVFERNRRRWDQLFARAHASHLRAGLDSAERCLARAVAVLYWNHKAPRGDLPARGVIPSPFAYRGYWGWDSWKHAHALAPLDPELAADQLRAQFAHQRRDGMVPDTAMARAGDDHWRCTKPPMAGWALEAVWRHGGSRDAVRELYPRNAAFLSWWDAERRVPGEPFHCSGGVDQETATWDSGWDDSARFAAAPLREHGPWRLFDLWQPDLNAYLLQEYRAMANLAPVAGADPMPWERRAAELAAELRRRLWDERLGAFADVRATDGRGTGLLSAAAWLPAWAGAATAEQLAALRRTILDPRHFATECPFPSLAASAEGFDPDGYWNGAVWVDHAALALAVLGADGEPLARRLLRHLAGHESLYECYSPATGAPCGGAREGVPQFSWTAAAVLEASRGGPQAL